MQKHKQKLMMKVKMKLSKLTYQLCFRKRSKTDAVEEDAIVSCMNAETETSDEKSSLKQFFRKEMLIKAH
jgi:hypothetical protein